MSGCEAITGCVIEASAFAVKARMEDTDGVALQQADISTITWKAWNAADSLLVDAASLTVATVISDTLLTTGWSKDASGYNFKHVVGDDVCVATGVHTIEYTVTLTGGLKFITPKFQPDVQDAASV